jgi:hypothetical protein
MRVTGLFVLLGLTLVSPRSAAAQTSSTPVDPSFDANIRRPVPPSGTKFTIKTVKPPLCGQ